MTYVIVAVGPGLVDVGYFIGRHAHPADVMHTLLCALCVGCCFFEFRLCRHCFSLEISQNKTKLYPYQVVSLIDL